MKNLKKDFPTLFKKQNQCNFKPSWSCNSILQFAIKLKSTNSKPILELFALRNPKTKTWILTQFCGGKKFWIFHLEHCSVMLLYNHTLTMDAHHGILSSVRLWKLNCKFLKTSADAFPSSSHHMIMPFQENKLASGWTQSRTMHCHYRI